MSAEKSVASKVVLRQETADVQNRVEATAIAWIADPNRGLMEFQRYLHRVGGCPENMLPDTLEDCEALAARCSQGRWYKETEIPVCDIPEDAGKYIRLLAAFIVDNNLIGQEIPRDLIKLLCTVSAWPLDATRQAGVFFALNMITGIGETYFAVNDPRLEACKAAIRQLVDGCLLGRVLLNTVNGEPYHPAVMQTGDRVLAIRQMIMEEFKIWMSSSPDFYFPLCSGVLTQAINDPVGAFAFSGLKILNGLLCVVSAETGRYLVDKTFLDSVKHGLEFRILQSQPNNRVASIARIVIAELVNRKILNSETANGVDDWQEIIARVFEEYIDIGQM